MIMNIPPGDGAVGSLFGRRLIVREYKLRQERTSWHNAAVSG
jgi:hypothetical protein